MLVDLTNRMCTMAIPHGKLDPSVLVVTYRQHRYVAASRYRGAIPRARSELRGYKHTNPVLQDLYMDAEKHGDTAEFKFESHAMKSMDEANIHKATLIAQFRQDGLNVVNIR
jgi:hypothetical protein